jgi:ankyrin repeat protein
MSFSDLFSDDPAVVKTALENGANPNQGYSQGNTPLTSAVLNQNQPVISLLIQSGADVNAPDKTGTTPLSYGARKKNYKILKELISAGADPNKDVPVNQAWPPSHYTLGPPLFSAVARDRLANVQVLLEAGADPNFQTNEKHTPLIECCLYPGFKASEIASLLIGHGAQVNHADSDGDTPLHLAIESDEDDLVRILLESGADPTIPNKLGQTPAMLQFAKDQSSEK